MPTHSTEPSALRRNRPETPRMNSVRYEFIALLLHWLRTTGDTGSVRPLTTPTPSSAGGRLGWRDWISAGNAHALSVAWTAGVLAEWRHWMLTFLLLLVAQHFPPEVCARRPSSPDLRRLGSTTGSDEPRSV